MSKPIICHSRSELVGIIARQDRIHGETSIEDTVFNILNSMFRRQRAINQFRRLMSKNLSSDHLGQLEALDPKFARIFITKHLGLKNVWIQPTLL